MGLRGTNLKVGSLLLFSESRFRDICSYVAMVDARSTHEIILTAICCEENAGRGGGGG